MSAVVMGLLRSNFRLDALLEPEPLPGSDGAPVVPTELVVRGRKEGI